jgi:CelD/BcsL family acetyltransferase involved in cellulose biosynthesis
MTAFRISTDLAEGQALWQRMVPGEGLFDLWEVRMCFQKHFRRPTAFVIAEENGVPVGFLPLSWIEEAEGYGCFPGETWHGKTWLEQNRIVARDSEVFHGLLNHCPGPYHLRYLKLGDAAAISGGAVDETGYLFHPPEFDYDMKHYFARFSRKSAKRLIKELEAMEARGVTIRCDDPDDIGRMIQMNLGRFGEESYFHDARFLGSFLELVRLLHGQGKLRITAVLIGGELAAVDVGCVHRNTYVLLAGGTAAGYPGVAKLINIHHMRRACEERFREVDFLCGDFSWKRLFHLTPRPLYLISNTAATARQPVAEHARGEALVG